MKKFILDAYNIIHKCPEMRSALSKKTREAESALLREISEYSTRYPHYKFIVVFDGVSDAAAPVRDSVKIIMSGGNKNADAIIKELIENETQPRLCAVVSSDAEIYKYARIHGCVPQLSEAFLVDVRTKARRPVYLGSEKPTETSREETEEMKKLFGVKPVESVPAGAGNAKEDKSNGEIAKDRAWHNKDNADAGNPNADVAMLAAHFRSGAQQLSPPPGTESQKLEKPETVSKDEINEMKRLFEEGWE